MEFALHYFYLESLKYQHHLIEDFDDSPACTWSLVLLYNVLFFVKYHIVYGIASTLTRFDWLIPPPEPRCLARVGSMSEVRRCLRHFMRNISC